MRKSGFNSNKITGYIFLPLKDVTSLTISNYGSSIAKVTIDGIERDVPAYNPLIGVPFGSFNIPGDGTACDLDLYIDFVGGTGEVILDYRREKTC
jgi:hypothetical protein